MLISLFRTRDQLCTATQQHKAVFAFCFAFSIRDPTVLDAALGYVQCLRHVSRGFLNIQGEMVPVINHQPAILMIIGDGLRCPT